jgi:thiol-disulfide isomerase/thioredoxin
MNRHLLRSLFAVAGLALACSTPAVIADDKAPAAAAEPAKAERLTKLQPGDKAPALKVESFLKGSPVTEFKAGHIYVVEFWATWCGPCIRAFPHLSELQKKHEGKVTFIGVNIWDGDRKAGYTTETLDKVTKFVEKQGDKMSYTVAFDGGAKAMDEAYMKAASQNGIPAAFIVNGEGNVAWIGHPGTMDEVLDSVIAGTWDVNAARDKFMKEMEAEVREQKIMEEIEPLMEKFQPLLQEQKFEEALPIMKEAATKAAGTGMGKNLSMGVFSITAMQLKDSAAATAYAKELAAGSFKDDAEMLNALAWTMVDPNGKFENPDLAAALEIAERANTVAEGKNPGVLDTLARAHFAKGDKAKAIEIQTKAVELAKGEMKEELQAALKEYKGE